MESDAVALRDETCIPCRDGGPTLDAEELAELKAELPGWQVIDGHHLHKHLEFADFRTALDWLSRAGAICEEQGHHGDFRVGWGYVDVDVFTHKANGLTRADAVLAAKFDAIGSSEVRGT
ncbi:4a-hydroxytetrahydrobiopterin dehydratase [Cyanobium sp. CH-040]|uniref:4a-hydroxytetrahydrobiopterin dehydratase n=1 Tax=Cyanobium sp. CH-040 TaxID=2823708 RepID=UPI0020CC1AD7|nr:4a-hydroxytetrahydrobiopterin dehydratase [Cyanobium sp. CH-040]